MPETVLYRVEQLQRDVDKLDRRTENVNVMESELKSLGVRVHELSEEVSALRKAILTAALSFVGGFALLAISLYATFG